MYSYFELRTLARYEEFSANNVGEVMVDEVVLNTSGYQLLTADRTDEAIQIFQLAVREYQDSWNTYDSLGEAYMARGDRELAIENYEKSLELNPDNGNGIRMLEEFGVSLPARPPGSSGSGGGTTAVRNNRMMFSLPDLSGRVITSEDQQFEGKVVLVDVWGSWCAPCLAEIPHLVRLYEKYHDQGLEIVGPAFENGPQSEQLEALQEFVRSERIPYTILFGGSIEDAKTQLPAVENFYAFPTTIFIDRDGRVRNVRTGFTDDHASEMEDTLQGLLAENVQGAVFTDAATPGRGRSSVVTDRISLRIWKVGDPYSENTPATSLPIALTRGASERDLALEIRTFPARGFAQRFSDALLEGSEPDILAFDNFGVIRGTTTDRGVFEGIGTAPTLNILKRVFGSFESLQDGRGGWEYLVTTSRHQNEATALAFHLTGCNVSSSLDGGLSSDVVTAASAATFACNRRDRLVLDDLSGGHYADESLRLPDRDVTVHNLNVCSVWGNQRIAFAHTVASFDDERELGQKEFLSVLHRVDSSWELMLVSDRVDIVTTLRRAVSLSGDPSATEPFRAPELVYPPDEAELPRFPERSALEWTSSGAGAIAYLVEWQYGAPPRARTTWWSGSQFMLVPPSTSDGTTVETRSFGIGSQPHRWRIWSIDRGGDFLISDWRILTFTN